MFQLIAAVLLNLVVVGTLWACPACLPAGDSKGLAISTGGLFVLGVIPLMLFAYVVWRIFRLEKNERS